MWLSAGHVNTEDSRLSSLLALAIPGIVSFAASFLSRGRSRFSSGNAYQPLEAHSAFSSANFPKRPKPFFLPLLVLLIVGRVELLHRVSVAIHCSKPGIEAFLPFIILVYELFSGRKGQQDTEDDEDEHDYLDSTWDRLGIWFRRSRYVLATSVLLMCFGVFLSSSINPRSTVFCASFENRPPILSLQWLSVTADGAIVNLAWRILACCRSTRSRLRRLGFILVLSAIGAGLLALLSREVVQDRDGRFASMFQVQVQLGLDHVHRNMADAAICGLAFSAFFISSSLVICEHGPLTLVATITFFSAFIAVVANVFLVGTWENVLPGRTYYALLCIFLGFSMFVYAKSMQTIVFIARPLFIIALAVLFATGCVIISMRSHSPLEGHPLRNIIYQNRIEADRWLTHASVSQNVRTAAAEYRARSHGGRDPPPKFDVWFEFAMARKSPVMDHFAQMEKDLLPFWGMAPAKIREIVKQLAGEQDIAVVSVQDGVPSYSMKALPGSHAAHSESLDALMKTMGAFSAHLPDMQFAVNMNDRPRVLAPWDDVARHKTGTRRAAPAVSSDRVAVSMSTSASWNVTALACPPDSKVRARKYTDTQNFCSSCVSPHSMDQFLTLWELSLDLCHQPDLFHLHGFHTRRPDLGVTQQLVPVFSRSKTDSYSDILMPLPRPGDSHHEKGGDFETAENKLFWRGRPDDGLTLFSLNRGHQQRLVHMAQNPSVSERTAVLLLDRADFFLFEHVSTKELNSLLSMDVSFEEFDCKDLKMKPEICQALMGELVNKTNAGPSQPAASSRFLLAMDTDTGPPPNLVSALRSRGVPFVASVFREWYTERLMPWAHFVPVDLRFHALHSTLAYFAGLPKAAAINGRVPEMGPHNEDGKWIADNGRRWAETALRTENMEVYLFRLLLEWAWLVDDKREVIVGGQSL